MPSFFPLQPAFNAGELSGRVRGRVDLDIYKKGLSLCENWEPLAQGSMRMRAGTEHQKALAGDNRTRLLQFRTVNGEDYLIELFDKVMRLYAITNGVTVPITLPYLELVQNGNFSQGSAGWVTGPFAGVATITSNRADLDTHGMGGGPDIWIQQMATLPQAATVLDLVVGVSTMDTNARCHVRVDHHNLANAFINTPVNDTFDPFDQPIPAVTDPLEEHTYHLGAFPAGGIFYISIHQEAVDGRLLIGKVSLKATLADGTNVVTPWPVAALAGIRVTSETGMDRAVLTHGTYPPQLLQRDLASGVWGFRPVAFSSQPAEWTGTTWPSMCEFSKGRAWWSGVTGHRNRLWGSVSGDPFNLTIGEKPGDALDEKVATNGAFRWLRDSSTLVGGTDLSEHTITGSMGVPLVGDITTRRESFYGSADMPAVDAGELILYISPDRLRVRGINYDFQTAKWKSNDLLFVAEHIVAGPPADPVKELHFVWTPDGMLVGILDSGKLVACSLNTEQNINAWWRAPLSSGLVRSAAVSRGASGAYLWLAVERAGLMYLERMPLSESISELHYVDASKTFVPFPGGPGVGEGDPPIPPDPNVPFGAALDVSHLANGTAVRVIVDGELYPNQVVAGGVVTCPADAQKVVVGLVYRARARTLPPEGGNPAGSSLGFKVHNTNFVARVNNSAAPLVNGTRLLPDPGDTTPADAPELLRTADLFADNIDVDDGAVLIEQDLPYRTEVCAIGGKRQLAKV